MAEDGTRTVEVSEERVAQIEAVNVEKEIFVHHAMDVYRHLTQEGMPQELADKLTLMWMHVVYVE